jgi:hypothetical protein
VPLAKICSACRRIHNGTGPRCEPCQRAHDTERNARRRHGGHTDPRWTAHSRRLLAAWRHEHGDYCPGDSNHPAHPSKDLTVHHPTPLTAGGSLTEQQMSIVCRSGNSTKGGRI